MSKTFINVKAKVNIKEIKYAETFNPLSISAAQLTNYWKLSYKLQTEEAFKALSRVGENKNLYHLNAVSY